MGGNDQWGNMTTGTELIRRTLGNDSEAFALTCPLITKADGTKFGKTEGGNIWLDRNRTTPYKFYQFWLNVSDDDAERYIKIFTSLDKPTIDDEVTTMVHSVEDLELAKEASVILFGKGTKESLAKFDDATLLSIFEGVPQFKVSKDILGQTAVDIFTSDDAKVFASKGEMRKLVQGGGVSLNKEKLQSFDQVITESDLLNSKYLLVQRGKKNYYLITVE